MTKEILNAATCHLALETKAWVKQIENELDYVQKTFHISKKKIHYYVPGD